MFQLMVLIALVCVPILSLLAIKVRVERQEQKKAQTVQESAALQSLYERQL
jgi:Tfp pilus assembly protein PilV